MSGGILGASTLVGRVLKSGLYYPPGDGQTDTTFAPTADRLYAVAWPTTLAITVDRIGLEIVSGVAASTLGLGIYDDAGGYPGDLVLDAGTVSLSTGFDPVTIDVDLGAGLFWAACVAHYSSGSPVLRSRTGPSRFVGQSGGSTTASASYAADSVTGALPATFPGTVTISGQNPKMLLRVA